jgi:hypothetical protein
MEQQIQIMARSIDTRIDDVYINFPAQRWNKAVRVARRMSKHHSGMFYREIVVWFPDTHLIVATFTPVYLFAIQWG